ncbi:MAG: hypothetical protein ACLSFT_06515 [Ruminococcus callidus]
MDSGPASDVQMMPCGWFIRAGLIGTGFAQPNPVSSSSTAPKGSTCASGFSVSRPQLRRCHHRTFAHPAMSKLMQRQHQQYDHDSARIS